MNFWRAAGGVFLVLLVTAAAYGIWKAGHKLEYTLGYEDQVKKTVRELVRPEALR
jgi:hypothetical protein